MKYCLVVLMLIIKWVGAPAQGIDASPAGVMISHGHPKQGWMVSYTYMGMYMKDNLSGTRKVTDDEIFLLDYSMSPQNMRMDMHMIMLMYGLTGRLSLMGMASYNNNVMEMKAYSAGHVHGGMVTETPNLFHEHHSSGIGDVKLWAMYKLMNREKSSLVLSAGLNLPSGNTHIPAGEHATIVGERQAYMMQLGSGTFDMMPGLTYMHKKDKLTWSVQTLAVLRPFNNADGYHFGNEITVNAWSAYQFNSFISASLRAESIMSAAIEGQDKLIYKKTGPDSNPANYGGTKANAYAGINFYITKSFMRDSKIGIEYGLPIYQDLNGPQMAPKYSFSAGITKSF